MFIAVLQGATEFFPVSSLGHAVVLPQLIGWDIDQESPSFLPFLVVLHVGTAVALLMYFWRDWLDLALAVVGAGDPAKRRDHRRLAGLIILATIPAVILGGLFADWIRNLFASPLIAAALLVVNGFVLFVGEKLRVRSSGATKTDIDALRWQDAIIIGFCQCAALAPGISRSGATIVGGLVRGFHHEAAARFSFLIATPIIFGAAVHETPHLIREGIHVSGLAIGAGVVAGVVAFVSTWILMRYFKRHDFQALNPFAYYCWAVGGLSVVLLSVGS